MTNYHNDTVLDFITNTRLEQFAARQQRLARKRGLAPPDVDTIIDATAPHIAEVRRSGVMVDWQAAKAAMKAAAGLWGSYERRNVIRRR